VIRTDTLHELFSVATLLDAQPVPRGDRVVIVTNAGGPGILCADACQADGVDVPELPPELQNALLRSLPAGASARNPIDMIATASADDYRRTMQALIEAEVCDSILTIFVPPLVTRTWDVANAIRDVAETKPPVAIAAVFMTSGGPPVELESEGARVPGFEFPEDAARAVALAAKHGRWRARPEQRPVVLPDARPAEAAAIISHELAGGSAWLSPARVAALLDCYGLPLIPTRVVADADAAAAAAEELGVPVALKADASGLIHKTDAGGVKLGVQGREAVRAAAAEIESAVAHAGYRLDRLVLQPMAPEGVELIVGVVHDQSFGPVIACGAGGTTAELIRDVAVRITPIGELDAREMLHSLKTFPLLDGYRGAPRCDVAAVEDVLLRVGVMVEAHPEIAELDCNPLIVTPDGAVIVDARVRIESGPPPAPMPSLRA
jgi:acyl-CoA synthetase (NDP forming)